MGMNKILSSRADPSWQPELDPPDGSPNSVCLCTEYHICATTMTPYSHDFEPSEVKVGLGVKGRRQSF